jgi:hypothetical protein
MLSLVNKEEREGIMRKDLKRTVLRANENTECLWASVFLAIKY